MSQPSDRQATLDCQARVPSPASLKLWLFVDERPSSQEHVRNILAYLQALQQQYPFELETIEVEKQPHLAEHFRLIATPALVKISPEPRHTLAGTDLVAQLENCWPQWCEGARQQQDSSDRQPAKGEAETHSATDSAEQLRLADEIFRLQREKEELEEQLRFKDRVLAMWAHDLRNPLTAASIALETLELAQKNTPPLDLVGLYRRIIEQAQNQFQIMNRMIGDILETAKGNYVGLQVQPQYLLLQDLAAEVLEQFAPACAAKSLSITQDLPQDLPAAYGDRELVRQVFVNLLDNAVKYTPTGGHISLAILHRTMQKLQVSIADSGPGIPAEKQEQIFQGHVRLERDTEKDGYGLGLSLCLQVVRAHYGQIWVDSELDRGSCFHFTLPVFPKSFVPDR